MNLDEERKAFDAYFRDKYPLLYKDVFDEDGDDRAIIGYSFAWQSWQAAKANEAERLRGCVMIPVEPTDEIIEAMDQFDSNFSYADMRYAYKAIVRASRGGK